MAREKLPKCTKPCPAGKIRMCIEYKEVFSKALGKPVRRCARYCSCI